MGGSQEVLKYMKRECRYCLRAGCALVTEVVLGEKAAASTLTSLTLQAVRCLKDLKSWLSLSISWHSPLAYSINALQLTRNFAELSEAVTGAFVVSWRGARWRIEQEMRRLPGGVRRRHLQPTQQLPTPNWSLDTMAFTVPSYYSTDQPINKLRSIGVLWPTRRRMGYLAGETFMMGR